MPTKRIRPVKTNTSVDVLNAIRNSASQNYKNYIPIATPDADSIKAIGNTMRDYTELQNEFISALVNRIAKVIVTNKNYTNPLAMFKRGRIDYGETIEDIFINLAKPYEYNPEDAEATRNKRYKPDVQSAFYVMNYQKFYPTTIQQEDLRRAFTSVDGVNDFIARVTDTLYSAMEYDEFLTIKYMLAVRIMNGQLYPVTVPEITKENALDIVVKMNTISGRMRFMSDEFNPSGVLTHSTADEQYIISSVNANAILGNTVFAYMYNRDEAKFNAHTVEIDSFGALDVARLNVLFAEDPNYHEFQPDELAALDKIPAVIVDGSFFQIYDNLIEFNEDTVAKGLYWNWFLHAWRTFAVSPFANCAVLLPTGTAVTSVTVSPKTATVTAGNTVQLTATVAATLGTPKAVNWQSNTEGVTVSATGLVTVGADVSSKTSVTITATSVADGSKKDTATITVA